jgi:integrase
MHNPAAGLKSACNRRNDRAVIDLIRLEDAETLIAAIHRDWGEAQGNYEVLQFFTELRPSEEIALTLSHLDLDLDLARGTIRISKTCVAAIDRNTTKTGDERIVTLCPSGGASGSSRRQ